MDGTSAWLAACAALCAMAAPALAQTTVLTDPATLHIGTGWGKTPCPTGVVAGSSTCGGALSGELQSIGSGKLDIYQNAGGAAATNDPLLILAIPYTSSTSTLLGSNALSGATLYPSATTGSGTAVGITYGPTGFDNLSQSTYTTYGGNQSIGYVGQWNANDSTLSTSIYSFLNLSKNYDSSPKLGSFLSADATLLKKLGTPAGYNVYVDAFNTSGFKGNSALNVTFGSKLPVGSFAVAYAHTSSLVYDTAFTQAGIDLPEPGSLSLLGVGVAGLAAAYRRTRRRRES